jgi:hypothetical protein
VYVLNAVAARPESSHDLRARWKRTRALGFFDEAARGVALRVTRVWVPAHHFLTHCAHGLRYGLFDRGCGLCGEYLDAALDGEQAAERIFFLE